MSVSIEFADGKGGRTESEDLATTRGYAEFGLWVDALPGGGTVYSPLIVLVEHGLCYDLRALVGAIDAALKDHQPPSRVRGVVDNLRTLISRNVEREGVFIADDS